MATADCTLASDPLHIHVFCAKKNISLFFQAKSFVKPIKTQCYALQPNNNGMIFPFTSLRPALKRFEKKLPFA
jgi:hypothetical protein